MTKKILYGTRNFEAVTADNGYYVDKTKFIEKLESLGANFEVFFRLNHFDRKIYKAI